MHELALAEGVLAIAVGAANEQQVERITLRVGQLQHVTQDSLQFSFDLMAEGTCAEGAQIAMEVIPALFRCKHCGTEGEVPIPLFHCISCRSHDLEVLSGEEMMVESVELIGGVVVRNNSAGLGEALEEHLREHHGEH